MVMDNKYKDMGLLPERNPIVIKVDNRPDVRWKGRTLFHPVDGSQLKLFMHCTDGLISATREFIEAYKDVFTIHNIEIVMEEYQK